MGGEGVRRGGVRRNGRVGGEEEWEGRGEEEWKGRG